MIRIKRWWKLALLVIVLALFGLWGYELLAVRGTFAPFRSDANAGGAPVVAGAPGHRIVGRVYVTGAPTASAPLVVLLHGDAPFINPGYQYAVANELANTVPGARVAALMRPGYADVYGARSDGDRGFASGENYTLDVTNDVAAAISSLKQQWEAPSVVLVGHSGGAVIAANIAALTPGLVQQVFLVACPCDVTAFRRHMAGLLWSPMWLLPAQSLSPMQTLERMEPGTAVTAISGANDPVALPEYARNYIATVKTRGIPALMTTLPDKGHEILDDPVVLTQISKAMRNGH